MIRNFPHELHLILLSICVYWPKYSYKNTSRNIFSKKYVLFINEIILKVLQLYPNFIKTEGIGRLLNRNQYLTYYSAQTQKVPSVSNECTKNCNKFFELTSFQKKATCTFFLIYSWQFTYDMKILLKINHKVCINKQIQVTNCSSTL